VALPEPANGSCPAGPAVVRRPGLITGGIPVGARVPGLGRVESYNAQFHWEPQWGLLGSAPGPGRCASAVGPEAGLALASRGGEIRGYLPGPPRLRPAALPFVLPWVAVILSAVSRDGAPAGTGEREPAAAAV